MSVLNNSYPRRFEWQVAILNEVECDAEGDVEAELDLSSAHLGHTITPTHFNHAQPGTVRIDIVASGKSGSPVFVLNTIEGYYAESGQWLPVARPEKTINADQVFDPVYVTMPLGSLSKLRCQATVTTLDGSNKITMQVILRFMSRSESII